ncbi:MAG TPA: TolC family protein [Polyangiaceae bacterium LLY-WYZ-14_1]|nr:TolC family protein [Polyangiaceae bacterium LLY-WYZ-14_1]
MATISTTGDSRRPGDQQPGPLDGTGGTAVRLGVAAVAGSLAALGLWGPALAPAAAQEAAAADAEPDDDTAAGFDLADLQTPGGLTAQLATERAVATAPSVERAQAGVKLAAAGAAQAYVGLFPRLDVSFRYTRLFNVPTQSLGEGFSPEQIAGLEAAVDMVQDPASQQLHDATLQVLAGFANAEFPIFNNQFVFNAQAAWPVSSVFLEVMPAYEAAERNEEASRFTLEAERSTIALQAQEAYFNYARAVGARVVAESSLEQVRAQREDIRVLVEAGSVAPVELERANALVASAEVGVAQARGGVRVAAVGLRVLLHDPELAELEVGTGIGEDLTVMPPEVAESQSVLVDRALTQRSEVKALMAALEASDLQVRSANGGKLPVLSLNGNLDVANPNQLIIPQIQEFRTTWSLSAVVSWSPNDFATSDAEAASAEAQAAQARADLRQLEDGVRLEVTQSYENYVTARESYDAAQLGIRAAEETYRVRREQLATSTVVQTDLIQAEAELTSARLDLLNAAIDARIARAQLLRAVDELRRDG